MPFIQLTTFVAAPAERVFDLSRSVDLHKFSMRKYAQKSISGTTNGLLNQGDTVTWQAKHLWKERKLKIQITAMQKPFSFIDEQVEGDFKKLKHEHFFKAIENGTFMIDQFLYEMPYGVFGKWISGLYLTQYLTRLLEARNSTIKAMAESNGWKPYLNGMNE